MFYLLFLIVIYSIRYVRRLDETAIIINEPAYLKSGHITYAIKQYRTFFLHTRACLLSGTRMAHEGALYFIGYFRSRAALEPTLSTRVNVRSLESRLSDVSLKIYERKMSKRIQSDFRQRATQLAPFDGCAFAFEGSQTT